MTCRFAYAMLAGVVAPAFPHRYAIGTIEIRHPYAVPTVPGATTGAGYIERLVNSGTSDDRLVGAASSAATTVDLHTMSMDGDVMRMRHVDAMAVPARGTVTLAPGARYHMMLVGLRKPLKADDIVPMTRTFEKVGRVDIELHVQERGAASAVHAH